MMSAITFTDVISREINSRLCVLCCCQPALLQSLAGSSNSCSLQLGKGAADSFKAGEIMTFSRIFFVFARKTTMKTKDCNIWSEFFATGSPPST
jgi:hypothetical protein